MTTIASGGDRTPLAYFDEMYCVADPWGFETSRYERRKYALTLACLSHARYRRAFEPGCSIGVLTEMLATRCDELVATEVHAATAERARRRVRRQPHVVVEPHAIPDWWPAGTFDLIVLSEIAYYFGSDVLDELNLRVVAGLEPGGDLVLVHWTGPTDYPTTGDGVHDRWLGDDRFEHLVAHREERFRLDVLRRRGGAT